MKKWNSREENMQCDSGISSGSDGEFISTDEREKRLQTLRQLARKLENALAPGNAALMRINRTLDHTQRELTSLHNQLSHLPPIPVKKVTGAAVPVVASTRSSPRSVKERSVQTDRVPSPKTLRMSTDSSGSRATVLPYWWRILRAALPFHVAILVLICAACSMEPSCCNYLNTFSNSFVPKLSYHGDPPPI